MLITYIINVFPKEIVRIPQEIRNFKPPKTKNFLFKICNDFQPKKQINQYYYHGKKETTF